MNIDQSLISKRDSTLVKGILILLIILGHNSILMQERAIYNYLYHFHVYVFLLLPFLYNIPQFTFKRIKKDFIHIYKPYTFVFAILAIINTFILNQDFNLTKVLYAYISGNEFLLRGNIGASFLWFMPTMFSLMLLRNYLMNKPAKILWICVFVSFLAFVATRVLWLCTVYDFPYIILGAAVSIVYFFMGVVSRYIYERYHTKGYFGNISSVAFILATICNFTHLKGTVFEFITWGILPISTLYILTAIVKHFKENNILTKCINYLGKYSLPIYLFHVIIYNAILLVIKKAHIAETYLIGAVSYIATLTITIMLIYFCKKSKIYKLVFC